MAKKLSRAAIEKINSDIDLSAAVAKILGLTRVGSLRDTLRRNGNAVNRIDRIQSIAKEMGTTEEDILEEVPLKQLA